LESGVIALTKCDLSDPDWIDLVEEEIRQLVADTFLARAPIVRVSAHTGQGLDELRAALTAAAHRVAESARRRAESGPFRLPIDRTFTIAGHGTVVTGSVASGRARVGDELVIEPGGIKVRVRGAQQHDKSVEQVHRGQRAALNLAGIHHEAIQRGQELATPHYLVPSRLITVRLQLLASAPRPLKNRTRVRLHVGTAEVLASAVLVGRDQLAAGETGFAQLFLAQPVVASWNQPFVLRCESPMFTLGGGQVLDPHATKLRRGESSRVAAIQRLTDADPVERASAALYLHGLRPWDPSDLLRMAGVEDPAPVVRQLVERGDLQAIHVSPTRTALIHRQTIDDMAARIEAALGKLHDQFPLNAAIDRSRLASRLEYVGNDVLVEAVLNLMCRQKRIKLSERGVALVGRGAQLSSGEQRLVDEIIAKYRAASLQPPTVSELQRETTKNQAVVPQLVKLAAAEGHLIEVSSEFYLHTEAEAELRRRLAERMTGSEGLTLSQIREMLETTRKYAVPFCEYLDKIGFTRREGDLRYLAANDTT
jgi:selenocysteine-specific elongation factor